MGLFSFVGGLLGASAQKRASHKAEAAQLQYLDKAIGEEQRQYDTTRGDFAPYRDIGTSALSPLGDLTGSNGNDKWAAALEQLKSSPLYQSLFSNGQNTILANASATGGLRGGDTQRSLGDFGRDTLTTALQQHLQELMGTANLGLGATNSTAAFGQQGADNIAGLFGDQGKVRAGGLLTRGGLTAGMWNSAGGFADSVASALAGAGAGPGGAPFSLGAFAKKIF